MVLFSLLGSGLTIRSTITVFISTILVYCIGFLSYYLYFHPLAKYPGPFLAKFSNLYSAYYSWTGDIHLDIFRCHKIYGPVVRYAPNRLLINSVPAMKTIYGHGAPIKKADTYDIMIHGVPSSMSFRDKVEHNRRRKIINRGFSDIALRKFQVKVTHLVRLMCDQIAPTAEEGEWSKPFNMSDILNYLVFDIMSNLVFGFDYSLITNCHHRHIVDDIRISNIRIGTLMQAPVLRFARIDRKIFNQSIKARNSFLKFIGMLLRDRKRMGEKDGSDIFALLTTTKNTDTSPSMTDAQITAESITLVVAGSDTTSAAIASTLFYLSVNQDVYAKVSQEIRDQFKDAPVDPGDRLSSCRYLRACIDEAMRISPPVGGVLWREVEPGGMNVDGHWIPAGCTVGTAIYPIHHDPNIYPRPFDYIPERWLEDLSNDAREAFNPFSLGPRSCVAKGLALLEAQLTLATILARFEFTSVGPCGPLYLIKDHLSPHKDGPILRFSKRN